MKGSRHKRYGGGLGGTTADSVLTWYASPELMEAEQRAFNRAVAHQQKLDQTLATRVLGKGKRRRGKRAA